MADTPKDKYACIREAVSEAGIALPPILPGTTVRTALYDTKEDFGTSADFTYYGPNLQQYQLRANDMATKDEGRYKIWGFGETKETLKRTTSQVGVKEDLTTGAETAYGPQAPERKPGTAAATVDRLFKCLDPAPGS